VGNITVHPHACGEQKVPQVYRGKYYGSSPRLWGTELYTTYS